MKNAVWARNWIRILETQAQTAKERDSLALVLKKSSRSSWRQGKKVKKEIGELKDKIAEQQKIIDQLRKLEMQMENQRRKIR